MFLSVKAGKLTVAGALTGGVMGFLIFLGAGYTGIAMIGTFFILGSAATSWKMNVKQNMGLAEKQKGRRVAGQVIANGSVAGTMGLLAVLFPQHAGLFRLMMAASLASATADTLSSELGNVYGTRYYNILTFRAESRGPDGVVSAEGTLFGIAGSIIIALIYGLGFGWNRNVAWIILAGITGNIIDSVLGGTLQRRGYLNNDTVNLLNTVFGAIAGWVLWRLFH